MGDASSQDDRNTRRRQLREANLQAWARGEPAATTAGLDSALKRNTALIKRLRTSLHPPEGPNPLLKEMAALRLDKYVSEVASAVFEGASKCKTTQEIISAVEIISALHQRFVSAFSVPLIASFTDALAPPGKQAPVATQNADTKEKDDVARISKQRNAVRLFGELEAVAFIKGKDGGGRAEGEELFDHLKRLITADKTNLSGQLPLVTAFCRHLGDIFLPLTPTTDAESIAPSAQKEKFKTLLVAYFEALAKRAVKDRLHLLETDKRNHEAYIRSGEIFEDRAQAYERATKTWEKEWTGLQTLAECLGDVVTMPPLPELPSQALSTANVTLHETSTLMDRWSDEEERIFYEDLPDLRDHLPLDLLGGAALNTSIEAEVEKAEKDVGSLDGERVVDERTDGAVAEDDASNDEEPVAAPTRIDTLLKQLPTLTSKEESDKLAIEIALQSRDKANRRRAVKAFIAAPRSAQAVVAQYARVIAILSQIFPDIAAGVLTEVGRVRLRTAIYLSEITKFGITPQHIVFHVFKACTDDLNGINIEHFCALLEGCGRYLLRTASTRERMQQVLDVAKRKQAVQNLDQRFVSMLQNAFVQCDPPERLALPPKIRSNTTLYIDHLIYGHLSRSTIDQVFKSLRKLHWDDQETRRKLFNAFSKPWKIRSSHLQLLALLLHDLKAHPDFQIEVIDAILERIRATLEINNYKLNQRRVADIKYIGELYNFRLVPSRIVFDVLWMLMTFAHPDGRPRPDMPAALDMPDDFFRARLVCVLLDACHTHLDKGSDKRKIDHVLIFFELYLCCKQKAPMDIEYMVQDTFDALRPKHKRSTTLPEAASAFDDLLNTLANEVSVLVEEEEDEELDLGDEEPRTLNGHDDGFDDDELADDKDPEPEEVETAPRRPLITEQEQEAFDRELAAMASGSSTVRPSGKQSRLDVGLPIGKRETQIRSNNIDHTVFTMLSRRGGKAQTRTVEIPDEVSIALSSRTRHLESLAEREAVKRAVLSSVHHSD